MSTKDNNRKFRRVEFACPVKYQVTDRAGLSRGHGISRSIDISRGGIKLVGSTEASRGDEIKLTLQTEQGSWSFDGRICWHKKLSYRQCEFGVCFDDQAGEGDCLARDFFNKYLTHED